MTDPTSQNGDAGSPALPGLQRMLVLDGLRGVAAFGVINDHVMSHSLRALTPGRYLAVDFFWVLSGFVLALSYDARLRAHLNVLDFMRIRVIRFYPLYLLGLVIAVFALVIPVLRGWEAAPLDEIGCAFGVGLLFLPFPPVYAWTGTMLFPLNSPSWTLFFELVVNAFYGVMAKLLTVRLLVVMLVLSAALLAIIEPQHAPGAGWKWPDIDAGLVRTFYCFFAGVLLFRIRPWFQLPSIPAWLAGTLYVVIIAIPTSDAARIWYNLAAALVFFPLLVGLSAHSVVTGMAARVCAVMGVLSYGVYILHVPLKTIIDLIFLHFSFHAPGYVMVLVVSSVAGVAAWVAHHVYDVPVRRWLSARLEAKRSRASSKGT